MTDYPEQAPRRTADAPPPVFRKWSHLYVFVVCYLAGLIGIFYIFSRAFAP